MVVTLSTTTRGVKRDYARFFPLYSVRHRTRAAEETTYNRRVPERGSHHAPPSRRREANPHRQTSCARPREEKQGGNHADTLGDEPRTSGTTRQSVSPRAGAVAESHGHCAHRITGETERRAREADYAREESPRPCGKDDTRGRELKYWFPGDRPTPLGAGRLCRFGLRTF